LFNNIMDNDETARLTEAVLAMNVRTSSPVPLKMPADGPEEGVKSSDGIDSGYASQRSTPDAARFADTVVISGNGGKRLWSHPLRKPKKLKPYNKLIPATTRERFSDLRELYADSLNDLTRSLPNCPSALMSLQVLGEDEATAEPWVFVQCDKKVFKKVSAFFKQPLIKMEFEPPNPSPYSPRLRVLVCPLTPRQLAKLVEEASTKPPADNSSPPTVISANMNNMPSGTLCGLQINTKNNGMRRRMATIGGLIMLTDKEGEKHFYGLTAGHFLSGETYNEEDSDDTGANLEDDDIYSEEEFELDMEAVEGLIGAAADAVGKLPDLALQSQWPSFGTIHASSESLFESNRDWALITIKDDRYLLPNKTVYHGEFTHAAIPREFESELAPAVAVLSTRGLLFGNLSNSWAYTMLPPGKVMVRTYLLSLRNKEGECTSPSLFKS
jgi:hypothetical protein